MVIVHVPYYNAQIEKASNSYSKKATMNLWLENLSISFRNYILKIELYELILENKQWHVRYIIDEILAAKGYNVISVIPYHPELIWAEVK